ncbi:GrpB family protein [Jeotgalibacillus aurantiacus]|uniref:GrpB family protein n=1 Tax=Jeotgalibacillus aurantiacus TaxID=2763266 RepID=UPI001D0A55DF|nr:GrpB family protein [Jeotgalibacillus aurantiacus]
MRKTTIMPYTESWAEEFEREAAAIRNIFNSAILYHIGSTSVPAIGYAKPVIDILGELEDISEADRLSADMERLGYEVCGENGIPGRRFFTKGGNERTHHVHLYEKGNEQIDIHLNFKRYLLEHPTDAKAYGELKLQLLQEFPDQHEEYQTRKQPFVSELAKKANEWALKERSKA